MNNCPFCGAKESQMADPFDYICDFSCGTIMNDKHGPKRGIACYNTELSHLHQELTAAREVVEAARRFKDRLDCPLYLRQSLENYDKLTKEEEPEPPQD